MIDPQVLQQLAPDGVLRAAINLGNPVLAQRGADGEPQGVSVALARALAEELGASLELITFDAAGKVFAALAEDAWRVAFLAIEPVREQQIAFSAPYVAIKGTYLVAADSALTQVAQLDAPGKRIAVGQGAAYDLYLSRTVQHAELVRAPTSAAAVDWFIEQGLDAAAGVRDFLQTRVSAHWRLLDDNFMTIHQAMAVPVAHAAAAAFVKSFVERQKAKGGVKRGLLDSGQSADLQAS
ncbi:transporter substrate-binding domain-containing protein [Pseudomonas sp. PA-6-1D]|jgi:polar amino acid transport system substrate-binding protein|uniref:Transporter substrate-binding domain-containing protein n=5 Tax=Pseudomonas edaphica TaxID=2006980 RepID=A0A7Y8JHS6_9PSED|nr:MULTISPECIES: transporter substrate-binding domain-containing protein [Pseudomonas]MCF5143173.1 transporter substrate-binding domain-containing protein [Pseudomonas sp. PA-6-3C]MCF5149198.1 transporter substrate-binding domain-containing protein [Pseudomonas sp. PA-6-3F]MCF5162302.1 transporter substrate-binding domain-containing protein [Pseudomonas sp. PA-6-2E]MCF5176032.1 transporter substrate-binding domain-containing protein [Pseudomonas sp. PA-6-1D]MCF5194451.1 transporter substrate-b